jgi:lipopolysaccharide export system permease protein
MIKGKLSKYIAKNFLVSFALAALLFSCLIVLIDLLEVARRAQDKDVPLSIIFSMVFFKLPNLLQEISFFLIFIASLITLNKLNNNLEIAVMRASGMSVWKIIKPLMISAFIIGLLVITALNPYVSWSKRQYEKLNATHLGYQSLFENRVYSNGGLWLKQDDGDNKTTLIRAPKSSKTRILFFDAEFISFDADNNLLYTLKAEKAELKPGQWFMKNVMLEEVNKVAISYEEYQMPSSLNAKFILKKIENTYADTSDVPFWKLPRVIKDLQESGFSASRYKVYFNSLLALPFLFVAMVMVSSCFSLLPPRSRKVGMFFVSAIILSFVIFFLKNIIGSFGGSARLHYIVAAWFTPLFVIATSTYYLLWKEEARI